VNAARQSDAAAWWQMGRTAKARNMDIAKMAADIISEAARKLFLDGAEGRERPRRRPAIPTALELDALKMALASGTLRRLPSARWVALDYPNVAPDHVPTKWVGTKTVDACTRHGWLRKEGHRAHLTGNGRAILTENGA
jgi:hypothetical protein